jgi:cell division protein FtsI (penicillin-binding protein 3)
LITWRLSAVLALIYLAACGLTWRIYNLSVLDQPFLRKQGDERALRLMSVPTIRSTIFDRHGFPLAVSTKVYSVWVNPVLFSPSSRSVTLLAHLLGMKPDALLHQLTKSKQEKRGFIYLKRGLSPTVAAQVDALNLSGVYSQVEYHRYYPEGEAMAQLIGLTNVDDEGQEGLELAYDHVLKGDWGKQWVLQDRLGRVISTVKTVKEQASGQSLTLSIDRRIQYLAYHALMEGVTKNEATSGTAIVLDAKTGEILAMANYPSFNPNRHLSSRNDAMRNRAVTDTFEPGSTMKVFSVASALASGHFKPDTVIDTAPGWMRLGHNIVRDEHEGGALTVTQILQRSSNVGVTKMVLDLPSGQLWSLLHRVGFGETTGIHFPGEQSGMMGSRPPNGSFPLATLAFGYGISATPLQLARAYLVIANEGKKIPVSLLKLEHPPAGETVMPKALADTMLTMLESVTQQEGTGALASVAHYRVAGKTGTALKAKLGERGYQKHHYISSFVGIAPRLHPRLVVLVMVDDPQGKTFYGGMVSGPIFSNIMGGALRTLNISPDSLE